MWTRRQQGLARLYMLALGCLHNDQKLPDNVHSVLINAYILLSGPISECEITEAMKKTSEKRIFGDSPN